MANLALEHSSHLSFLPANASPFKGATHASFQDRLEMLAIVTRKINAEHGTKQTKPIHPLIPPDKHLRPENIHVDVLDMEGKRPAPSFTFETMRILREQNPGQNIALVIGSDSLASFGSWREPGEILLHHPLIVFVRHGDQSWLAAADSLRQRFAARIQSVDASIPPCASRQIRAAISASTDQSLLHECLDNGVLNFIKARGIYSNV